MKTWSKTLKGGLTTALLCAAMATGAEAAVTTPTLYKQHGYMNGYLNICFKRGTVDTSATVQVQVKPHGADDSAYALAFSQPASSYADFTLNLYDGRYYRFATNLVGAIDVRVRLWKADDDCSDWLVLDNNPITGYTRLTGKVIGTQGQKNNAFDGNMFSICDGSGSVGYDFGEPKRIKGIRWFGRPDNNTPGGGYGGSCFDRIIGSTFDYASDEAFSDGVTILTCTKEKDGGNTSPFHVNEHWFDEPVTAQYIRYFKPNNAYGGLNEFEVIPWDCPFKPVVTVMRSDLTNFWPVVSWTYQDGLAPTEVRVERATAAEGPFAPVTDWTAAGDGGCITNSAAYADDPAPFVGLQYYYRVVAKTGNPSFIEEGVPQEVPSATVAYRRYRRLDRSWDDETKLLEGASIMLPTNGNWSAVSGHWTKAWDGNPSTFADIGGAYADGPIGLEFSAPTWVGAFGYICRSDNWCYCRVQGTALYAASGEDQEVKDKVQVSDLCQEATQDTRLHVQGCSKLLDGGASCYFLYFTKAVGQATYFGGNVAELMFFGWDAQDIAKAGVLVAPKTISFANTADHLGVTLVWDEGSNASGGYSVERRVRGSGDEWTSIGDVAAGVTTFTDTTMTQGQWEYRVVAKRDDVTAASPAFVRAYYAPADGEGLKRIVYWPFGEKATSFTANNSVELENGALDFDFQNGTPICPDGPSEQMFLACEGKLVVPFAGSYTITHETSDGGSVWIDGHSAGGHWSGSGKTTSSIFELSAGEHDIQVYTRIENSNVDGRRKSVLKWSGPVGEEVIPACQLRPAAKAYDFTVNAEYDYRQFQGNDWAHASVSGNKVTLRGTPVTLGSQRTSLNVACAMMKTRSPYCNVEFHVARRSADYNPNGTAGVIVHADNGNALLFYFDTNNGDGNCVARCKAIKNGSDAAVSVGSSAQDATQTRWYRYLRLTYEPSRDSFCGYHKYESGDEWTQLFEFPNEGNFGPDSQIGFFAAGGGTQSGSFDITVTKYYKRGGAVILVR